MDSTTIDQLNHDCLVTIFSYLHPFDLMRAEHVCRQWQTASRATWALLPKMHQLEFIDFDRPQNYMIATEKYREANLKRFLSTLRTVAAAKRTVCSILERCGPFFASVTISTHVYDLDILSIVAEYCPEMRYLKIAGMYVYSDSVKSLAERCRKIVEVRMICVAGDFEDDLELLFANSPHLSHLTFSAVAWFSGQCLAKIVSETFESLCVVRCSYFQIEYLGRAEHVVKRLRHFTLLPRLYQPPDNLHMIRELRNLRHLEVDTPRSEDITDDVLLGIYRNCQLLESIEIVIGEHVTETGILALLRLPLLKSLELTDRLSRRHTVWIHGQYNPPFLQTLGLDEFSITEEEVCCLVDRIPRLQYLFLNRCQLPKSKSTDDFVKEITRTLKIKGMDVMLEIVEEENNQEFIAFTFQKFKRRK